MNTFQKENLEKLAIYLESGNHKAEFDMEFFVQAANEKANSEAWTDCGSVGCAIGHGPYAGVEKYETETWPEYANRAFAAREGDLWDMIFGSHWARIDNTPEGAAKRIRKELAKH